MINVLHRTLNCHTGYKQSLTRYVCQSTAQEDLGEIEAIAVEQMIEEKQPSNK